MAHSEVGTHHLSFLDDKTHGKDKPRLGITLSFDAEFKISKIFSARFREAKMFGFTQTFAISQGKVIWPEVPKSPGESLGTVLHMQVYTDFYFCSAVSGQESDTIWTPVHSSLI